MTRRTSYPAQMSMPPNPGSISTRTGQRVAWSEELRGGGPRAVSAEGVDLVLVRGPAGLRAFQGRCPHQGALLGEGELDGPTLVCRNHRWRFGIENGRRQGGGECLTSHPVWEQDGEIYVDIGRPAAAPETPVATLRQVRDLPFPKGVPLLGNLPQIDFSRLHQALEDWARTYGPVYRYRMGPRWFVVVSDPTLATQLLRARPETYRRFATVEPVFAEMGVAGVFSAEGAAWRPQRRLAMEALSPRHLRGFFPTLRKVAERLKTRWDRAAGNRQPVDIVDDLKRFTVDVTTSLAFGHDLNTLEQGDQVIQRHLELVFPAFNRRLHALIPTWRFIRMPSDRRLDRALAALRVWLGELVAKARHRLAEDPALAESPSNFLEAMISARDEAGRPFSDDVVFGNLMTMLLAGEDTTAYSLAWAVHELCDSPASVTALRSEVDSIVGPATVPEDLATADRLAYVGAVANEAMRLRPVAPLGFYETNADTRLGDLQLPAKTTVVVLTRPPAVDPGNFAAPDRFRPERWLEAEPTGPHDPSAHMPFGSGPRLCPGRSLALLEMKVVLGTLYRAFDVQREGPADAVRENFAFTMSPAGLRVQLRPRS